MKTQEEWESVLNNDSEGLVTELTAGINERMVYDYIKIAYVCNSQCSCYKKEYDELKEEILEEVGEYFFHSNYEYFRIWFNLVQKGTYYIYIPINNYPMPQ